MNFSIERRDDLVDAIHDAYLADEIDLSQLEADVTLVEAGELPRHTANFPAYEPLPTRPDPGKRS